jgi:hypothetical protein
MAFVGRAILPAILPAAGFQAAFATTTGRTVKAGAAWPVAGSQTLCFQPDSNCQNLR